jgi:hypothetical protein
MGLATFWGIFSKTHPVTLVVNTVENMQKRKCPFSTKGGGEIECNV